MTEQFNPLSLIVDQDASESFDIKSGGGQSLEPLPAGVTLQARLCGYVELGVHEDTNPQGQIRDKEEVRLFFQVWGKQLQKDAEGNQIPRSVMLYINKSASDKGHWLKVFNTLNHDGKRNNMASLLGAPCRVKLVAGASKDPSKPAQARLRPDGITGPVVEVMDEDGNVTGSRVINPPMVDASEVKVFQFHKGTREQWDTLPYFLQEAIKEAKNIEQSPAKDYPMKEAPKSRQKAAEGDQEEAQGEAPKAPPKAPQKPATPVADDDLFGDDDL
jgi:hypothetical protein